MKGITVLSLPLLASGAVLKHELHQREAQRQKFDIFGLSAATTKPETPLRVKKLTASLEQTAVKEQVLWGPFKLQPANGTHDNSGMVLKLDPNSDIISTRVAGICKECMVLSAQADLADKDGNKLDIGSGVYSHHVIVTSIKGQRMVLPPVLPKCADGKMGGFRSDGMVKSAPKADAPVYGHGHARMIAVAEAAADAAAEAPVVQTTTAKSTQIPVSSTPLPISNTSPGLPIPTPSGALSPLQIPAVVPSPNPATKATPPGAPSSSAAAPPAATSTNAPGTFNIAGTGAYIPGLPTMESLAPIIGGTAGAALGSILGVILGAPLGGLLGVAASTDIGKQILGGTLGKSGSSFPSAGSLGTALAGLAPNIAVFVGQGDDGAGNKFFAQNDLFKSGFYLGKDSELNLMTEVVNYNRDEKDIYVKVEYEYIPNMQTRSKDFYDVGMGAINVAPCESVNLMPPKDGPVKYTSPPWTVHQDGYLLDIKPHLHDGGLNMTLYVNGEKKCASQAVYGGTDGGLAVDGEKWETITSYSECPEPVKIKVGDAVTMDAYYDLTQHRLRPQSKYMGDAEGMALANFIFAQPPK